MVENIAISFLKEGECSYLWQQICEICKIPYDSIDEFTIDESSLTSILTFLAHPYSYQDEKKSIIYCFLNEVC